MDAFLEFSNLRTLTKFSSEESAKFIQSPSRIGDSDAPTTNKRPMTSLGLLAMRSRLNEAELITKPNEKFSKRSQPVQ